MRGSGLKVNKKETKLMVIGENSNIEIDGE